MKYLSTLRSRLLVSYLGLILIGVGGLTLFAGSQMATTAYTDFAENLRMQTFLLASTLNEPLEHLIEDNQVSLENLRLLADAASKRLDVEAEIEILFIADGRPLGSKGPLSIQDIKNMPEVHRSTEPGPIYDIRANAQGIETLYTAAPIVYETTLLGYAQVGRSASIPQEAVQQRWLALGGAFVAFSGIGILVCLWLLSSLTRPLSNLRDTALEMAGGDLSQRITSPKADEIGEVGSAFNQMADQVEAMVAEQRAFASNASHELRTPITTIRLRTEWLLSGMLDDATAAQYIREIDQEVNRMGGLVDDLILLSRLEAHRLEIGQAQIDPVRLMQKVEREITFMAESKAITLALEIPAKPLPPIQANMNHLQVVFRNLVENALKYTPASGMVTVLLASENDTLRLEVRDNGRGIAPEDLPHLTKRFYRGDKAHSRQIDGVGLGLALVQSIVDLYGGRFQMTSAGIDQGTTATVWWPFIQTDAPIYTEQGHR